MSLSRYECFLNGDSPGEEAVERDELLLPDGPDVVLEGLLQLVQLIPQLVRRRRVVPAHAQECFYSAIQIYHYEILCPLLYGVGPVICISREDKLENPMQCCFSAMYLRLPFSIAPEFVKANSEKAQGLSRRASGRSLGRSVPQKLGSRAAVEMIMFTVQTFPPNTELVLSRSNRP